MRRLLALLGVLSAAAIAGEGPPSQTVVFYNARIALRENRPQDALKLWLVRNALVDRGQPGTQDPDFRSVVWASLGRLGVCQEGYGRDDRGGAGLWPLALHNWVLGAMQRGPPLDRPSPFESFEIDRQQRFISLQDVVSPAELRSVAFFRGFCLSPYLALLELGEVPLLDLKDRLASGRLLKRLLYRSKDTLAKQKVKNLAILDARIFDLDLALTELQARESRRQGSVAARLAKQLGITEPGVAEVRKANAAWPKGSSQAAFLRRSLTWTAEDWLSLNRQRRLFLFSQARLFSLDPAKLEALELAILDGLIDRRAGDEVQSWLAFLELSDKPQRRGIVTAGERGKRLLELDPETGFRERATIALQRGVSFLEAGERMEALRSFAFAMQHAEDSREAAVALPLARRWTSNVLDRYETTPEVVSTLRALVPRAEFNAVIEDLVWRAALRADRRSFEVVTSSFERGGGFEAKVTRLRPLAEGKAGPFATALRDGLIEEPYLTLRFVRQLLEQLEVEEAAVRRANVPLLRRVAEMMAEIVSDSSRPAAHHRNAEELLGRAQGMLDGLDELDLSGTGQARALSPDHQTYAGSIRLAPSDPLPWPFTLPETAAPSAFTPLELIPVEWRDARGELVFGWRISE